MKDFFKVSGALNIIYKGEIIKKEDTYFKRFIVQDATFFLVSGALVMKRWKRFTNLEFSDYFYMSDSYWDAV